MLNVNTIEDYRRLALSLIFGGICAIALAGCADQAVGGDGARQDDARQHARPFQASHSVLIDAIGRNDIQGVRSMINAGLDLSEGDPQGFTALHAAARANRPEIAQLLLEHGAKVDARAHRDETPLLWAARFGSLPVVKLLVEHGADVNARGGLDRGRTPLSIAVTGNHKAVVEFLLEHGGGM